MNLSHTNHYVTMFFIMLLSGFLSTMNVWVDKWDDMRFSINDVYMTLLMTGWMFLFMGWIDQEPRVFFIGVSLIVFTIWGIRTQFLITQTQYELGMIPHHSMAVHMSKKLVEKGNTTSFVNNLIHAQEDEIVQLKQSL